jgi:alanine dehydrogenase
MVLILSRQDIESILDMKDTMRAVEEAFKQYALGTIEMPLRTTIRPKDFGGTFLVMPAFIGGMRALGLKVVTVYPKNPERFGLPTILATIMLNDPETGAPLAVMDGAYVTAMRTGAVSGVATKYLARRDANVAGIFGAGVQARTQLWAIAEARQLTRAKVFDIDSKRADQFCKEMSEKLGIEVVRSGSAEDTIKGSHIIATATTSKTPIFEGRWLEPGMHVNGIGSHSPDARELDTETIRRCKIVVDQREAASKEAGDLMTPVAEGAITWESIHAELGEIVTGRKPARTSESEITLFKSVGLALQDISTAQMVYQLAKERHVGKNIDI